MPRRISSPRLVARDDELAVLHAALTRAKGGEFSLVLVESDAGIGKTRLVRELERSPACASAHVLRGGCVPLGGEEVPYGPIVAALHTASREALDEAARSLPPAVLAELAGLVPMLLDAGETARDGSRGAQGRLYEYLVELLRRLGEAKPVMLVLEDVHWADQSTRDFLSFAARNARSERLLVIATIRLHDDSDDPQHAKRLEVYFDELERCESVESMILEALSEDQVRIQMQEVLGGPPAPEALQRIAARTQGNPFYVEELLAAGAAADVPLPEGRRAALLARVKALPPETQDVVAVLAACGRTVPQELLGAAAGVEEPQLSRALRPAAEAHVVEADEHGGLMFRHALTREAVYDALLPGEKRQLHASVARAV